MTPPFRAKQLHPESTRAEPGSPVPNCGTPSTMAILSVPWRSWRMCFGGDRGPKSLISIFRVQQIEQPWKSIGKIIPVPPKNYQSHSSIPKWYRLRFFFFNPEFLQMVFSHQKGVQLLPKSQKTFESVGFIKNQPGSHGKSNFMGKTWWLDEDLFIEASTDWGFMNPHEF